MKKIDDMVRDVIRAEGGYNDIAEDRGGPTSAGISLRYARGIGLDNDHDGDTDADDIRLVTPEQAAALYKEDFYVRPRINVLPEAIQPVIFDWGVNSGPARPIMVLQEILNAAGFPCGEPDGRIGKQTREAACFAYNEMGPLLVNAICEARVRYYRDLVARDGKQQKFLVGWTRRANSFRMEA